MGGNAVCILGNTALFAMIVALWLNMHGVKLQWNSYRRSLECLSIPMLSATSCQPHLDSWIKKLLICR